MNRLRQFVEKLGRTPIVPLLGFPGIQLTGTSLKANLTDSGAQTETLLALYEEFKPDALFTMMDLTVEAEFIGCSLKFPENEPPAVLAPTLVDEKRVEDLFENKTIGGRMPLYAEVVKGLKRSLDIPVCAYVTGPFTLAAEIVGLPRAMKDIIKEPDQLHRVLSKSTELIINYVSLLEDAGADLICVLEPSAVMISPVQFQEFSGPYCKKLISHISTMSVLHICGNANHLVSEMEETGPDGLSLAVQVNLPEAYDRLSKDTVLIGNVDPVSVVLFGEPDSVKRKSEELINAMVGKRNFVFSTGCDIPQNTPFENIKAMMSVKGL